MGLIYQSPFLLKAVPSTNLLLPPVGVAKRCAQLRRKVRGGCLRILLGAVHDGLAMREDCSHGVAVRAFDIHEVAIG